jgi:hypothetical protein
VARNLSFPHILEALVYHKDAAGLFLRATDGAVLASRWATVVLDA